MASQAVTCTSLRYAVDFGIADEAASEIHVEVHWPESSPRSEVLFCLPGGGMNRRYFDLMANDDRFSFARQMAARGYVSVLVDTPGVGQSDRPADGHALTIERITSILASVHEQVVKDLQEGNVSDDLAAIPSARSIGVGHSMGAMLTVLQQHAYRQHTAIVLLGFGTQGLPQFLPASARDKLDDIHALREILPKMAREGFPKPYPVMPTSGGEAGIFGSSNADPAAVKALKVANDVLLPVPAMMSMLPGNVAPECAEIDVPVYLALGDRDLIRDLASMPASFPASPGVQLQELPQTGHSHFLFPAREQLFDGLAAWAGQLNN